MADFRSRRTTTGDGLLGHKMRTLPQETCWGFFFVDRRFRFQLSMVRAERKTDRSWGGCEPGEITGARGEVHLWARSCPSFGAEY